MFENISDLFQFALPEHLPPSDEKQMELWKDKFSQVKSQRLRLFHFKGITFPYQYWTVFTTVQSFFGMYAIIYRSFEMESLFCN